ncbi:VCBS repeat-containing protein [Flavobacteriaceae bacterium]|nr:VCBS repeat-containing protein [Flavobacteriaceae bacterium]
MKNLPIYISLLFILTCAKEDSQAPNTPPIQIVKQYALTASSGEGGSVTGGGTFASGTQVSLTATPTSGYSFSGWSNGSTANPLTVTLNSNTTITANFQVIVNSYTLTVTAGEGGTVNGGGEYEEGTEVTITATPDEGYEFIGWSDGETSIERVITISSETSISANFEEVFYTLNKNEILISEIGVSSGTFAGMVYHQSISGSFTYNNNGNQYLFIPGMACSLQTQECDNINSKEEVDPKPGLHFKKTSEGWELLKIYEEVKTWGIRNFKVKDNFIAMGDGNEIGSHPWSGDMWFGEIQGDEIIWNKVNNDEQHWFHGTTIGDLNNDGLYDIGGAPGKYVSGEISFDNNECMTNDGTNGGPNFLLYMQNQDGSFTNNDLINYPLSENDCRYFNHQFSTIEYANIDNDPEDEIIVSNYINNIVVYDYKTESNKFELVYKSSTPYPEPSGIYGSTSIRVYDFNNDGIKDISLNREHDTPQGISFSIWMGKGNGQFEPNSYGDPGFNLSWRESSVMDIDNDGDYDIVLKSNFGYFTKDQVTTDDGYNNWEWGITAPNEAGVNPNSLWKGVLLNELFWINDGSGNFSMYDEKPLYIDGIFPQQLIPYKQENKFFLLGFRNLGYDDQNQLKTEFYDLEIQF